MTSGFDLARALDRASGARAIPGNQLTLLSDGPAIFAAIDDLIASADRFIHFENYIMRSDTTGWRVGRALAARARDGVAVHVLFDAFGSRRTSRRIWRFLRDEGVAVRKFRPVFGSGIVKGVQRDHRKLVAVDGREALLGGFCIGDEWASGSPKEGVAWRDTAVRIAGPAARMASLGFARMWAQAGPPLDLTSWPSGSGEAGDAVVRIVEGVPGRSRTYRALSLLAAGAADRFWVTDAYFVPPPPFIASLRAAARDATDVRVLVPGKTDIPVVRALTRTGYRHLLEGGMRIYEWEGPMLHAKTVLVDGRWSRVGSSNLNVSSLVGNYELDVLADDARLATDLADEFRRDLAKATEVVLAKRRLLRGVRPRAVGPPAAAPSRPNARLAAAITVRQLAAGARRSLAAPLVLGLCGVGVLLLALPRLTAWLLAGGAFSLAAVAAREGFRQRRETRL